ncbi:MAG: mobile mystery protein B [Alphaproteobacteria bacterium]
MKFVYAEGATPFEADEIHNLLQKHISTQKELDELEQRNIVQGSLWAFSEKRKNILTSSFLLKLHKKMFDEVWSWAGKQRDYQTNIGVAPHMISLEIAQLLGDVEFQIQSSTYHLDEIVARFHHRLVCIHPFRNGNGRHARLMADLLLYNQNQPIFTWGKDSLGSPTDLRKSYITALKSADKNDINSLLAFVRS